MRRERSCGERSHRTTRRMSSNVTPRGWLPARCSRRRTPGIHNQSWFHHVTHSVGHWASTHWTATLREVSKVGTIVSALAGAAALILAVAGVAFPPLEAAAAVLESVSLVSAVAAGMADTALAATGKASWSSVGVDALSFAPAGLGKLVTKAAPLIREGRFLKPTAVVHASNGEAARRSDKHRKARGSRIRAASERTTRLADMC